MNNLNHFKCTSDLPYDKHKYKLIFTDGSSKIFEYYEDAQVEWFKTPSSKLSHIEVLDPKIKKGFK